MSAGVSGKKKSGAEDDNMEDHHNDDNKKTTTDSEFQQRNVGDLTSRKLEMEKKYNPFYVVAQSIAIRVGTMDLTKQQQDKETEAETRKPGTLKKGGGSNLSATSSAAMDIGRQLFEAKGRSLG